MFTGIISAVGKIASVEPTSGGARITVLAPHLPLEAAQLGESIAVNGVCLTAINFFNQSFDADVSAETLRCTVGFELGSQVNLERALRVNDRLGGHIVSGHVDGVGTVISATEVGDNWTFWFEAPASIARYVAVKGSICINGISLTVNEVMQCRFSVNIIPHTLAHTNLQVYAKTGARVNLEADTVARYVERLNQFGVSS